MSDQGWLALTEYSSKYNVSISTLRRRIKSDQVEYEFSDGKYYLKDAPLQKKRKTPEPRKVTTAPPQQSSGHLDAQEKSQPNPPQESSQPTEAPEQVTSQDLGRNDNATAILEQANQLVSEIKKAYSVILHEKEEQIIQLKGEVADLKTLVRVLEGENERLKGSVSDSASIDGWLKSFD